MQKATHGYEEVEKTTLTQILTRNNAGKYVAILSDDAVDRQGEIVGRKALEGFCRDGGYVAGLIDHENKALNHVCQWTNKRIETVKGHTAFVCEPKWFLSNPNAQILKGMLDEGAELAISIGAIVKSAENVKIDGVMRRVYTELELVEASFVGIPANKHAHAVAIAKSFNPDTQEEQTPMEATTKTFTQEEFDAKVASLETDFAKKNEELALTVKQHEDARKALSEELELVKTAKSTLEKQLEELKAVQAKKALPVGAEVGPMPTTTNDTSHTRKAGELPVAFKRG